MRVLVVNQYFPPDTSATAGVLSDLRDALVEAGHEVTVIAGRPSYDPRRRLPWRPWRFAGGALRVGSTAFDRRRAGRRAANYLTYLAGAAVATRAARADVIVCGTDPPLAAAAAAAGAGRRPLVYSLRDLHPDFALATGLLRPGPAAGLWERAHRWALRRASVVVALGEDMAVRLRAKGVVPTRIRVVRDGAPLGPAPDPADSEHHVARKLRSGFRFVCVHAGNIGFGGDWDTLLEAARVLEGEGVGWTFVGGGAMRAVLERRAPPAVRFFDFEPGENVRFVMAAGDLQVVTLRPALGGLVVPSKLYGILAGGRPILAVVPKDTDAAAIVESAGCGYVCEPGVPEAVAAAVRSAMADPDGLARMGVRAREAAAPFDRARCLREFVAVVESAARGSRLTGSKGLRGGGGLV